MEKSFDPERINSIFALVSSAKNDLRIDVLNAAMANLVKALQIYISTPMLKKEKEILEDDFYNLELKIAKHPKFAETYGPVSFTRGEHKMAIEFMAQLIQVGAEGIKEKIEQGQELLEAERKTEAGQIFREVIENPAADFEDFIVIGDSYLKKNLWNEAQGVFSRAIKRYPESINLLNRLAISLRKDKKHAQSLAIYRKAILLSPHDEGLYFNVARLFLEWGKPDSAGQALRKALSINPKFEAGAKLLDQVQESMVQMNRESKEKA